MVRIMIREGQNIN